MKTLANKKIRATLHRDIVELLEDEMIVKLAETFKGARVVYAERYKHQKVNKS